MILSGYVSAAFCYSQAQRLAQVVSEEVTLLERPDVC